MVFFRGISRRVWYPQFNPSQLFYTPMHLSSIRHKSLKINPMVGPLRFGVVGVHTYFFGYCLV